MSAKASLSGRASLRRGMGPQVFDRFAAIEFNLEQIESELNERIKEVDASVAKLRDDLTTTRSVIEQQEREREESASPSCGRRWRGRRGALASSSSAQR